MPIMTVCLFVYLSIYPVLLLLKVHYKKGRKVHTLLGMGSCKQYTWGRMVEPVTPHQAKNAITTAEGGRGRGERKKDKLGDRQDTCSSCI